MAPISALLMKKDTFYTASASTDALTLFRCAAKTIKLHVQYVKKSSFSDVIRSLADINSSSCSHHLIMTMSQIQYWTARLLSLPEDRVSRLSSLTSLSVSPTSVSFGQQSAVVTSLVKSPPIQEVSSETSAALRRSRMYAPGSFTALPQQADCSNRSSLPTCDPKKN